MMIKDKEIEELKTKLFLAEERIKTLQGAVEKCMAGEHHNRNSGDGKSLLVGDGYLKEVQSSDRSEETIVRTLPEADMDLLKSWVTEKMDFSIKSCVIYCGYQDLLKKDVDFENVFDDIGTIVAEIKRKNENVNVNICELVPSLNREVSSRIDDYNLKLSNWCDKNGVAFIKTNSYFKFGTGNVDESCYDIDNSSRCEEFGLSRIGAIRLLDAIANVFPEGSFTCSNWNGVKQNSIRIRINMSNELLQQRNVNRNAIEKIGRSHAKPINNQRRNMY